RGEQREVVEPGRVFRGETLDRLAALAAQLAVRLAQPLGLLASDAAVVDARSARRVVPLPQDGERDEQRAAGERRRAGVRRVAGAGGPERQHLPERLPGGDQKVDEPVRLTAQIADTVRPWQGGRMEQDARGSWKPHSGEHNSDGG